MKKKATPGTALIAFAISLAAILGFLGFGFGLGLLYLGNWMMEVSKEEVWELPPMVSVAMEREQAEKLYENLRIKAETPSAKVTSIRSMDISQTGEILLGCQGDTILILDQELVPKTRLSLTAGCDFYVLWNGETVQIILERGKNCVEIDRQGKLIAASTIRVSQNEDFFFQALRSRNTCIWEENHYRLERAPSPLWLFAGGEYSRLVVTYTSGKREILLDTTDSQKNMAIAVTGIAIAILLFAVMAVISKTRWTWAKRKGGYHRGKTDSRE